MGQIIHLADVQRFRAGSKEPRVAKRGGVGRHPRSPTLEEIGWFRFTIGRIGDFNGPPIVVSRTGYTGELGYEVWCHPKDAVAIWDAVWAAGKPHKLTPLGLEGLDLLRIESGLVSAGAEWCDQTDPFEAGIGFTVPLKNQRRRFCRKSGAG